ncbi:MULTISPECIES: response regulator transcription factor [Aquitalea]|uniref:response regulator transcription factor n=1 Tax=Aquitalea TaxID=407217 RepID=UPI0007893842|nr:MULTISPECIES: response regulator [Aquitalea]NWK79565.1 response regulator transcription factor [Aquitalea sp. LB_tupeE]QBJ79485.1 DNA-binding response regulator [Aquitalea sp. USM4]
MKYMMPTVFIVDDDPAVRDSLALLIMAQGMRTVTFASAMEFLETYTEGEIGCMVLDIRMPQITGLALQEKLVERGLSIPIVFITGHGDIEQCRRAFQSGAIDFLTKPIDQNRLIDSLRKGIRLSIQQQQQDEETQEVMNQLARISGREREVLELVADGLSSKEIARQLDLSPRTIEVHRANLFSKLGVDSLADLIRFYLKALEATGKKRSDESFLNETAPRQ